MMEDCIPSSPQRNDHSIHASRMHRRNRRHRQSTKIANESVCKPTGMITDAVAIEEKPQSSSLADLYWKAEPSNKLHPNNTISVQTRQSMMDFDPFEDEMLLAAADRLEPTTDRQRNKQLLEQMRICSGFLNCTQLMNKIEQSAVLTPSKQASNLIAKHCSPQTFCDPKETLQTAIQCEEMCRQQCFITESELMHCCNMVEDAIAVQNGAYKLSPKDQISIKDGTTVVQCNVQPKKHQSLVDTIRVDLASSPYPSDVNASANPTNNQVRSSSTTTSDYTPENLRTNSRRRSSGSERLNNIAFDDADEEGDNISSSCSSGLSIQQDRTPIPIPQSDNVIDLNKSINICENLLNLSAYFTQQFDASIENTQHSSSEDSNKSFEAYFASINDLRNQIYVLGKKREYKLNYENSSIEDFHGFSTVEGPSIKNENSSIATQQKNNSSEIGDRIITDLKSDPIAEESVRRSNAENEEGNDVYHDNHENDLFYDNDEESEWNDECDFFRNFKTQEVLPQCSSSVRPIEVNTFQGFMTASQKPIEVSESAKERAAKLIAEFAGNIENEIAKSKIAAEKQKASTPSEAEEEKPINGAELGDIQLSEWIIDEMCATSEPSKDSGLPKKASNGLKETHGIQKCDNNKENNNYNNLKTDKIFENVTKIEHSTNYSLSLSSSEIHRASSKESSAILTEDGMKTTRRFPELLHNFPNQNLNGFTKATLNCNARDNASSDKNNSSIATGFQTASKRIITISAEAQAQASRIFLTLPEFPKGMPIELTEAMTAETALLLDTNMVSKNDEQEKEDEETTSSTARKTTEITEESKKMCNRTLAEEREEKSEKKISNNDPTASDFNNIQLSEWPLPVSGGDDAAINDIHESDNDVTPTANLTTKRKIEHEFAEQQSAKFSCKSNATSMTTTTTAAISPTPALQRTPLRTRIENDMVSSGMNNSSPRTPANETILKRTSLISRKNLLTLSGRSSKLKKAATMKLHHEDEEKSSNTISMTTTPIKSLTVQAPATAPATPNEINFFAAAPTTTSTPHPCQRPAVATATTNQSISVSAQHRNVDTSTNSIAIDADFQEIEWESFKDGDTTITNASNKVLNLMSMNGSIGNTTKSDTKDSPTPRRRIERLSVYGNPPPISPILMASKNNCRPSGLRRGRSIKKQ